MKRLVPALGLIVFLIGATVTTGATEPTDTEKLAILWQDFCERKPEHQRCQPEPTPTPTPSPSPTPSATPSVAPSPSTSPSPSPTATATPTAPSVPPSSGDTVHLEAQAWWSSDGLDVPARVGHHIHVEALNFPAPGRVVDGVYNLRVKVTLHDHDGSTNWVRVEDGFGSYEITVPFVLGPCHDCSRELTIPVDFSRFQSGIRELRIRANIPDEQPSRTGAQRMFNSTGWGACVRTCAVTDRNAGLRHVESRGWYDDRPAPGINHEYQNQRADSMTARAGQLLDLDIQPGSNGRPTVFHMVAVNPNMHAADAGRVLLRGTGEYHGTLRLPSDLVPGDKIAIIGHDGKNGGVLVLRVVP